MSGHQLPPNVASLPIALDHHNIQVLAHQYQQQQLQQQLQQQQHQIQQQIQQQLQQAQQHHIQQQEPVQQQQQQQQQQPVSHPVPSAQTAYEDSFSLEPLSCVTCRLRKLRCDRRPSACTRCIKGNNECVYPPSRRRPAVRRRNVKELEARLAQVEELLKDSRAVPMNDFDYDEDMKSSGHHTSHPGRNDAPMALRHVPPPNNELLGQGIFEPLPSSEILEELNEYYFSRHYYFVPVVHPGRYREAYYSAPHRRPPMCLQYAIWANASHEHPKYSRFHDIFYQRARQYAERDELKGQGEHFLTLGHAQAWVLIATEEARSLQFTRAAMSSARCIRLVQMMALHRMDVEQEWAVPVLNPASSWVEQEERRRTFWSAYCIDSHASLSTGWPSLINTADIGTRLPSSEDAFVSGQEEPSYLLEEALAGAPYSTFAGAVMISYLFNGILRHVQRPKPDDNPGDLTGKFWKRHQKLDSVVENVFARLPPQLRLPENIKDPSAIHTHLHLHASVICLHHQAVDKMNEFGLTEKKMESEQKLLVSAARIVELMRTTRHLTSVNNYKSPLIALSMFCAASVYVYHLRDNTPTLLPPGDMESLNYVLSTMQRLAADHIITRSFLQQICSEIERHSLRTYITHPAVESFAYAGTTASIPLISRGRKLYPREGAPQFSTTGSVSTLPHGYVPLGNNLPKTGTIIELTDDDHTSAIYNTTTSNSSGSQRMYESPIDISNSTSADSRMSPHSISQALPQQAHMHLHQSKQEPQVQNMQQPQVLPQMPPSRPLMTTTPPVPSMSASSSATPPDSWAFATPSSSAGATFVETQFPVTSESTYSMSLPHRNIIDITQAAHQSAQDWSQQCVPMFQTMDPITSRSFNLDEQEATETTSLEMMGAVPGAWTDGT